MHPKSSCEKEDHIPFEEKNPGLAVTLLTNLLNVTVSKVCFTLIHIQWLFWGLFLLQLWAA